MNNEWDIVYAGTAVRYIVVFNFPNTNYSLTDVSMNLLKCGLSKMINFSVKLKSLHSESTIS